MGRWVCGLIAVVVVLAGCVEAPDDGSENTTSGTGGEIDETADLLASLRFTPEDRATVHENITVVVEPDESCVPVGCALWVASGEPTILKEIDITHLVPPGTHAFVEATATWERSMPGTVMGSMNLQWLSMDLRITETTELAEPGEAQLSSYVTNHGPDPASMILVALDPERLHEPVEVNVHVRVDYLDGAVKARHPVGIGLQGDTVPVTVLLGDGDDEVQVNVRGLEGEQVLDTRVEHNETIRVPTNGERGEYTFLFFENEEPVRLLAPEVNLTSPDLVPVDITLRFGDWEDLPPQGEVTWSVDLERPPYRIGIGFDSLDGQSHHVDADYSVTAPDGSMVIEGLMDCTVCFNYYTRGVENTGLMAGEYTFTVDVDSAQGWQIAEFVGPYGDD